MVYTFNCNHGGIEWTIYMGKDKYENEDLIKYGTPRDLWFHVNDLSSAHVYLRMPEGYTIHNIPSSVLNDCAQLVKANSIEGSKKSNVRIVYTLWSNLHKDGSMQIGQIGYHNTKGDALHYINVDKKSNEIVNRLNKTRKEKPTSWVRESREEYDRGERAKLRKLHEKNKQSQKDPQSKMSLDDGESLEGIFSSMTATQSNKNVTETAEEYEMDFI